VPIEGCDVNFFPLRPEELFPRVYHTQDFDVTELSASSHILTSLRGDANYLGIPAFVSRVFRHGDIYIRTDRGIRTPEDLRGRIVGVPEYQMTAALWIRGILSDEYGVKTSDIRWRNGGLQRPGRGSERRFRFPEHRAPDYCGRQDLVRHARRWRDRCADHGGTAAVLHREGAERGTVVSRFPRGRRGILSQDRHVPDHAHDGSAAVVGGGASLLPGSILKACLQARTIALEEMRSTGMFYAMLPWLSDDLSRAEAVMGPNMWPYGVTSNRKELEAMLRWSFEQGLAPRQGTVEEVFAPGLTEARWDTGHSP
jgi:4,5-dihydroxyphthalate decarboxylase